MHGNSRADPDPLFGAEVAEALESVADEADPLRRQHRLRERLEPGLARRAARLHELRLRSRSRFEAGWIPFLTPKGLEQASAQAVASARARRVRGVASGRVWDATCGVGADTLALAEVGVEVVASDLDAGAARCARANLAARRLPARVVVADAARAPWRADYLLLDPDRRASGGRDGDPRAWSPPLAVALEQARRFRGACLKLPPAFDPARSALDLPAAHRWQWVSRRRELCEVALWLGDLAGSPGDGQATAATREVLALDGRGGEARLRGEPEEAAPLAPAEAARVAWMAEPDPAVIRAGLLGTLARAEGLAPMAPRIAYLGGDHPARSPLLRSWRVLGSAPLDPRRVRALLAEHGVGPLTVKKRGHPDSAEVLARRLRGPGSLAGLLAVMRHESGHLALLLEDRGQPGASEARPQ